MLMKKAGHGWVGASLENSPGLVRTGEAEGVSVWEGHRMNGKLYTPKKELCLKSRAV